ncbi:MAG: flavodoxin family protein [Candidatus Limnocylindrales bacterium]
MLTVVIYDSSFGNTARVAQAIGRGAATLGDVRVLPVGDASGRLEQPDLLLVGSPTQRRRMSRGLREFLEALPRRSLQRVPAASFDTRYRMTAFLAGSAAREAAGGLRRAGCQLIAPPESFFIEQDVPPKGGKRRHALEGLEAGELERAEEWARSVATTALRGPARQESK